MKIFNKLVRDKIPEIIRDNGDIANIRYLTDEEYLFALNKKIQEELNEYLQSGEIEELADLEEVLIALVEANGFSYEDFEKIRLEKVKKRGAFKDRVFLESTKQMGEE